MKNKFLSGSFVLTAANLICKVLGVIYLIPWLTMMGDYQAGQTAQALYNVAYLPYALFLSLGTAGFPSGIAKKIASNNKNDQRELNRPLFLSALSVMEVIGVSAAVLMFIFAPLLAKISPVYNVQAAIWAIRSLCPSLVVIPILSAIRGYLQGENLLTPFSVSQLIEQIFRVIVILAGTFYIRIIANGSILSAVMISTAASSIGGLAAILYLVFIGKNKGLMRYRDILLLPHKKLWKQREVTKSIIHTSLPFIYVGSAISLAQLIDQVTLKPILHTFTHLMTSEQVQNLYTLASTNPSKLTGLLLSIVGSVSVASLPLISSAKSKDELLFGTSDTLRLVYTILLPASAGMIILATPLNTLFFGYSPTAGSYLIANIAATFFIGFFSILMMILQAVDHNRKAMRFTTEVLGLKALLQIPCVYFLAGYGISVSTAISFIVISIHAYRYLITALQISPLAYVQNFIRKVTLSAGGMTLLCLGTACIVFSHFDTSRRYALLEAIIITIVGGLFFTMTVFPKKIKKVAQNYFND